MPSNTLDQQQQKPEQKNVYARILFHLSWALLPLLTLGAIVGTYAFLQVTWRQDVGDWGFSAVFYTTIVGTLYTCIRSFFVRERVNKKLLRRTALLFFIDFIILFPIVFSFH